MFDRFRRFGLICRENFSADWRHGAQLAGAVVVAYACSAALRLPEGLWAVMSALIVLRPTASATADAGWDRLRGTLAGTGVAVASVAFLHVDRSAPLALLSVVLLIAFYGGFYPSMRSAPVSALIILSVSGNAEHSATQFALLRGAEIMLGLAVGLAISWAIPIRNARRQFNVRCAAVLREIADQVHRDLYPAHGPGTAASSPTAAEQAGNKLRKEMRALTVLAVNIDHGVRVTNLVRYRRAASADTGSAQRTVQLLVRTAHDASLFGRMADPVEAADMGNLAVRQQFCDRITGALRDTAEVLDGTAPAKAPEISSRIRNLVLPEPTPRWALAPAKLLMRDLTGLLRV